MLTPTPKRSQKQETQGMAQKSKRKLWRVLCLYRQDRFASDTIVLASSRKEAIDIALVDEPGSCDAIVATVGDLGTIQVTIEACALARNMAYAWARRHGLEGECAERILDMSIPSVVRLAQSDLWELTESPASEIIFGLAFYSHDNARRVRGEDFMAEKEAMLCWASGVQSGLHQSAAKGYVMDNPGDDERKLARRKALEQIRKFGHGDLS